MYRCEPCTVTPRPRHTVFIAAGLRSVDDVWGAELVPVREVHLHEGFRSFPDWRVDVGTCDEESLCTEPGLGTDIHDIAVLVLEVPVTAVGPVRLLRTTDIPELTVGLAQGYGERLPDNSDALLTQEQYVSLLNQTQTPIAQTTEQEILTAREPTAAGSAGDSVALCTCERGRVFSLLGLRRESGSIEPRSAAVAAFTLWRPRTPTGYTKRPQKRLPFASRVAAAARLLPKSPPGSNTSLFVILLFVLCVRGRRTAVLATALVVVAAPSTGCGSGSDASDVTFCIEKYDPRDFYCSRADALDLQTAEALARLEVPGDAWLWAVASDNNGSVGPMAGPVRGSSTTSSLNVASYQKPSSSE